MNMVDILTLISVLAACISACYACSVKRMQKKLVSNKNDIDRLLQLIETLKINRALQQYSLYFSDEDFLAGFDLSNINCQIIILKQNKKLNKLLAAIDWEEGMDNIDKKIEILEQCKEKLF